MPSTKKQLENAQDYLQNQENRLKNLNRSDTTVENLAAIDDAEKNIIRTKKQIAELQKKNFIQEDEQNEKNLEALKQKLAYY